MSWRTAPMSPTADPGVHHPALSCQNTTVEFVLEILMDGQRLQTIRVPREGLAIGRSRTNDVVLPDRSISKLHVRLIPSGNQVMITDVSSTSTVLVHGRRVTVAAVKSGESFQLGPYTLRVDAAAQPGQPVAVAAPVREPAQPVAVPASPAVPEVPAVPASPFRQLVEGLGNMTALVGVTDMQSVLESLLDQTMKLFGAQRGFIVLARDGELSPILARHGSKEGTDERFSRTVCQKAMSTKRPFLLADVEDSTQMQKLQSLGNASSALVLAIPLVWEDEVHGVLYMEATKLHRNASDRHDPFLHEVSAVGGRALRAALERHQIIGDRDRWQWLAAIAGEEPDLFRSGRSQQMVSVMELVRQTAEEDVTALILGESGAGKEVAALTIHRLSQRSKGPFVAINCGAIPRDLMEAELFGYEPGAFTGATTRKPGRLELAQGGTLLLDELGEMPLELQVKLLRVLETRTFERLGGSTKLHWNARLLGATNKNLLQAVADGQFRADLFYRLNVVTIEIPPLRDRKEDIEPLVGEMLLVANRRFKRKLFGVAPEALAQLQAYGWPGNVRELRNVIERAFILEKSDRVTTASLPFSREAPPEPPAAAARPAAATPAVAPRTTPPNQLPTLDEFLMTQERQYIQEVLQMVENNVSQAARILGLSRTAFHRRLRQFGLRGSTAPGEFPE
jgi:transcriptional regulator with GAF, ATPase, and Fis domain